MPIRLNSRMMTTRYGLEVLQHAEVDHHDRADEHLEQQDELALRDQVGLAGLVDQLRDFQHRRVHRQRLELRERHQAEQQAERADHQPAHQQRPAVHAVEIDHRQIGQDQVRFAAGVHGGGFRLRRRLRLRMHERAAARPARRRTGWPAPGRRAAAGEVSERSQSLSLAQKGRLYAYAWAAAPCRRSGKS